MRSTWLTSLFLLVALAAPVAAEPACVAAVAGPSVAAAPEPWQLAVARLVRSTARPGHPWSCSGGTVELQVDVTLATLTVLRRGDEPIVRTLTDPEDVVPLGQALLSLPREPALPLPAPATATEPPLAPPSVVLNNQLTPHVILGAGVDAGLAGGSKALLLGGSVTAGLPLDRWLATLQVHFSDTAAVRGAGLQDLGVHAGLARVVSWNSLDVRGGIAAGAAVLLRDLPRPQGMQARVDARIGAELTAAVPVAAKWHVFARLQAQWSPGRGADSSVSPGDGRTPYPYFVAGATVGAEVWR